MTSQRLNIFLIFSLFTLLGSRNLLQGQVKKTMTPAVYTQWNRIANTKVSDNGQWLSYELVKEEGDTKTVVLNLNTNEETVLERTTKGVLSKDGLLFSGVISPSKQLVKELRRKKTKKDDLPKDSLFVLHLPTGQKRIFPNVSDYKASEELGQLICFKMETPNYKKDTIAQVLDTKRQSKDNGNHLIVFQPALSKFDTIKYVRDYSLAKKSPVIVATTNGLDSVNKTNILRFDGNLGLTTVIATRPFFECRLFMDDYAKRIATVWHSDSVAVEPVKRNLSLWEQATGMEKVLADKNSGHMPNNWYVSPHTKINFDGNGNRMSYSLAPIPLVQDTTLLEEELVKVEVWHHDDPYLYTMQEVRMEADKEKTYTFIYDLANGKHVQLHDETLENIVLADSLAGAFAIGLESKPYAKAMTWEGNSKNDLYKVELASGARKVIAKGVDGNPRISNKGNIAIWFDREAGKWMQYDLNMSQLKVVIDPSITNFSDELNDVPSSPGAYGLAGFSTDESFVLLYDRYDIWQVNLQNNVIKKLTNGRLSKTVHRLVRNAENSRSSIDVNQPMLIHIFDESNKESGYGIYNPVNERLSVLEKGAFSYAQTIIKPAMSDKFITRRENFNVFPDLILTDSTFVNMKAITKANPQQSEYLWGNIELHSWKNNTGEELNGLVVLPEDFNPSKKYPLLINFYERSSDELHTYRSPMAGRSSINYTYYASKGYVIFNPDITYDVKGHPGASCLIDLMSGLDALIAKGYIDTTRMALQGHSWGGYQVAYLLTKTNRFKCAESGAPVVNMISAYGGIRWESGMSRMFQYEKSQSRIGKTLWEEPMLYLENSPIFDIDKVETPVLILHNDEDGAVPWYQGIEYYMALRRLGKPTWMLNYNGEPHWPVKWQNRLDFNIRMEQFFDHYLLDKPMPEWMVKGVPAKYKTILKGY